jgi:Holliday junction resolvase
MTNKKIGNDFEAELCDILADHGYWAHNMAMNKSGQPADVIAAKNHRAFLIDCKVCSKGRFALSRMEDNQDLSMELWKTCGNGEGWFAVLLNEQIYMIPHIGIKALSHEKSYATELDIKEYGIPLERWLKKKWK